MSMSSPRPSVARAAPAASWPSRSRPRPPPASSRSHRRSGASGGAARSWPLPAARTRPRRLQPARWPPGAENLDGAPRSPGGSSPSRRSSSRSTAAGPRSAARRSDARAWPPSSRRPGVTGRPGHGDGMLDQPRQQRGRTRPQRRSGADQPPALPGPVMSAVRSSRPNLFSRRCYCVMPRLASRRSRERTTHQRAATMSRPRPR